jgi:hypothetical protein
MRREHMHAMAATQQQVNVRFSISFYFTVWNFWAVNYAALSASVNANPALSEAEISQVLREFKNRASLQEGVRFFVFFLFKLYF